MGLIFDIRSDNLCKEFGPRSRSKPFDTLMVFLKDFFEDFLYKVNFEKGKMALTS